MSIVSWEPFGEMDSLFNHLVPTMLSRTDRSTSSAPSFRPSRKKM